MLIPPFLFSASPPFRISSILHLDPKPRISKYLGSYSGLIHLHLMRGPPPQSVDLFEREWEYARSSFQVQNARPCLSLAAHHRVSQMRINVGFPQVALFAWFLPFLFASCLSTA